MITSTCRKSLQTIASCYELLQFTANTHHMQGTENQQKYSNSASCFYTIITCLLRSDYFSNTLAIDYNCKLHSATN